MGLRGIPTKKVLKTMVGKSITPHVVETSYFGLEFKSDGDNYFVGPCAYTSRKWFAKVRCNCGVIVSVS